MTIDIKRLREENEAAIRWLDDKQKDRARMAAPASYREFKERGVVEVTPKP